MDDFTEVSCYQVVRCCELNPDATQLQL
jgi:hypothetical protein